MLAISAKIPKNLNETCKFKIHYLGRKLRGARDVHVWFGGKSMKVSKLLEIVANELNVNSMNAFWNLINAFN